MFAIANDQRSSDETVVKILPMLVVVFEAEKLNRQALKVCYFSLPQCERILNFAILGRRSNSNGEDPRTEKQSERRGARM